MKEIISLVLFGLGAVFVVLGALGWRHEQKNFNTRNANFSLVLGLLVAAVCFGLGSAIFLVN